MELTTTRIMVIRLGEKRTREVGLHFTSSSSSTVSVLDMNENPYRSPRSASTAPVRKASAIPVLVGAGVLLGLIATFFLVAGIDGFPSGGRSALFTCAGSGWAITLVLFYVAYRLR